MTRSYRPATARVLIELGETNMRCALMDGDDFSHVSLSTLKDHANFVDAIQTYCDSIALDLKNEKIGLLVALTAQPQENGFYFFKHNPDWGFYPQDVVKALNLRSIHFFNDIESHAYAVMGKTVDFHTVYAGKPVKDAPIALVSPGSGLGFAIIHPATQSIIPCLGAHMQFRGLGADDELYPVLLEKGLYKTPIFESVVSGVGLKEIESLVGRDKADAYFAKVMGVFCQYMALFNMTGGGIVFTGGLLPGLLNDGRFDWQAARDVSVMADVKSVHDYLENMPWRMIDDPLIGLKGLLAWARMHIDT